MMRGSKAVFIAGFAMFSMFFGSGNLVFPLAVGVQAVDKAPCAIIGMLISGVLVPFLGLLGVILYKGNRVEYLASIGKIPAFLLAFSMLALMGPFGVIPRCILVSYGGLKLFLSNVPLVPFALAFCVLTLLLVWKHHRIIPILGKILTPWLLGCIGVLIVGGLIYGPSISYSTQVSGKAFLEGFWTGYQMMDLLAAFFFSAATVAYIHDYLGKNEKQSELVKLSVKASLLGAGLLGVVYVGFILLGAGFSDSLKSVEPAQYLVAVAQETVGSLAAPVASITIILACLTTATILTMLFADFLREDILHKKIPNQIALIITLVISFFVSMVGFESLANWIANILEVAYPALIALTVANIVKKLWQVDCSRWAFWITFFVTLSLFIYKRFELFNFS